MRARRIWSKRAPAADCGQPQAANAGGFLEQVPQIDADDLPVGGRAVGELHGKRGLPWAGFPPHRLRRKAESVAIKLKHETAGCGRQCSPGELGITILSRLRLLGDFKVPGGDDVAKRWHETGAARSGQVPARGTDRR